MREFQENISIFFLLTFAHRVHIRISLLLYRLVALEGKNNVIHNPAACSQSYFP
jgi:heme/copper-type cytochrome/quinol oxidase subunit 3